MSYRRLQINFTIKFSFIYYENIWNSYIKSIWGHSFSTYAKFSEKLTFLAPWYTHVTCAYQGVRNNNFSENFACVRNEWSHHTFTLGFNERSWNYFLLSETLIHIYICHSFLILNFFVSSQKMLMVIDEGNAASM